MNRRGSVRLANEGSYDHGKKTFALEAALTSRYLLVKNGSTAGTQVDVCGATDKPLGICTDEGAIADDVSVSMLGALEGTHTVVASLAIAVGDNVYTAAGGKVTNAPAAGAYLVGEAIEAATTNGDEIDIIPVGKPELIRPAGVTVTIVDGADGTGTATLQVIDQAGTAYGGVAQITARISATSYGAGADLGDLAATTGSIVTEHVADAVFLLETDASGEWEGTVTRTADGAVYIMAEVAGIVGVGNATITGN